MPKNAFYGLFFKNFPAAQKIWSKEGLFFLLWESSENQFGRPKFRNFWKSAPPSREKPRSAPVWLCREEFSCLQQARKMWKINFSGSETNFKRAQTLGFFPEKKNHDLDKCRCIFRCVEMKKKLVPIPYFNNNKTFGVRTKPWMFRLPFKVYAAEGIKCYKIKWKKKMRFLVKSIPHMPYQEQSDRVRF